MNARQAWRKHVTSLLDSALDRNDAVLEPVSAALATAIAGGRHVYAFGAGHSLSLVIEMHRRAGSLKAVRPIWNPELTSQQDGEAADRLESAACHYATLTMAPTSTITGAALIHAAWTGAAEKLVAAGHVSEVWGSVRGRAGGAPRARQSYPCGLYIGRPSPTLGAADASEEVSI